MNAPNIFELYLYFTSHFLNVMKESILILEKNDITSAELHDVMVNLKDKLEIRIKDNFFGAKAFTYIKTLKSQEQQKFKLEAINCYNRSLDYIKQYYNFEDSTTKLLSCLNIKKNNKLCINEVFKLSNVLNVTVDFDRLYDEICSVNSILEKIDTKTENENETLEKLWVKLFVNSNFIDLKLVVSKALSVPISNAFVERIFSIMEAVWRDDRNRMRVSLVKAELATRINFDMNCDQFFKYLKKPEQSKFLKDASTQKKYSFKQNK